MLFSNALWFKPYIKKMDKPLKKELFRSFRHSKLIPSFMHNYMDKISFYLKKYNVIVKLEDNSDQNNKNTVFKILGSRQQRKNPKLTSVNSYYGRFSQKKLMKLLQYGNVKMIYLDRECKALLDMASPTLNAPFSWDKGITGKGVTTAVIDTGIHPHNDLIKPVNRILAFKDFVKKKKRPYDDNGHGTHVAGDIASNGWSSNGLYKAPAFDSCLVGVKVLDKNGSGSYSRIISGIEWCIENKDVYGIRIICMSLGSEAASSYKDDLICEAVEAAWKSGIVVCVAAGNEGPKYKSIASPGIDPVIITVGASDDKNTADVKGDIVAVFSSRGPTVDGLEKPDLLCPGTNIISLRPPRSFFDMDLSKNSVGIHYISLSGTSMATPLCCSVIALLLQKNPVFTPDQVKTAIIRSCIDMGYDKNTQGSGCLSITKLLESDSISKQSEPGIETGQLEELFSDMPDNVSSVQLEADNINQQTGNDVEISQPDDTTSDISDNLPDSAVEVDSIYQQAGNDVGISQPDGSTSDIFGNLPDSAVEVESIYQQAGNDVEISQPEDTTPDTYDNMPENSLEAAPPEPDNTCQSNSPETPADDLASQQKPDEQDNHNNQDIQHIAEPPENQPVQETDINTVTPPEKNKCSHVTGLWISCND